MHEQKNPGELQNARQYQAQQPDGFAPDFVPAPDSLAMAPSPADGDLLGDISLAMRQYFQMPTRSAS